jgi:hypothetical protein
MMPGWGKSVDQGSGGLQSADAISISEIQKIEEASWFQPYAP